jgi:O-antigen/teichoic acid export membrane protein
MSEPTRETRINQRDDVTHPASPIHAVGDAAADPSVSLTPRQPTSHDGLARRSTTSAGWVFLSFSAGRILSFATSIVLARILVPADFGTISLAMVLIGLLTLLQELGIPSAVVFSKRNIESIAGTALTLNVAASIVLMAFGITASFYMDRFGGTESVSTVTSILTITLLFNALGSIHGAAMFKSMKFKRKSLADVIPIIIEAGVAIPLALSGFGVWSLVAGRLAQAIATTFLLWGLSGIRPRPEFHRPIAAELLGYGRHVTTNAALSYGLNNVDYLIVGYYLGPAALGIYTLAFMIASLPATAISQVALTVMFPAYSEIRSDQERLFQVLSQSFTIIISVTIATSIIVSQAAPTYVMMLFDSAWNDMYTPLQILAIFGAAKCISSMFSPAYRALGHPRAEWQITTCYLILLVPALLYAIRYDISGISVAHAIVAFLFMVFTAYRFIVISSVDTSWWVKIAIPQIIGVLAIAITALIVSQVVKTPDIMNIPTTPLVHSIITLSAYLATQYKFNAQFVVAVHWIVSSVRSIRFGWVQPSSTTTAMHSPDSHQA